MEESREKIYNRIKTRLTVIDIVLDIVLLVVLAFSGLADLFAGWASVTSNLYVNFLLFALYAGLFFSAFGLPFDFYGSYIIEHRFELSNQSVFRWAWERIKSLMVSTVIGVPVALVFYYFLKSSGENWWLYFSVFIVFVSVVLARLAPVLIFPLFYKFKEIEDGEIKERIEKVLSDAGVSIKGIYSFNMSKDTKKANAGFTGLGKTKRIILSDTLIEDFSPAEIAVVFAHETGHYMHKHIVKNLIFSTVVIFATLFVCGRLHAVTIDAMGITELHALTALPVLMLFLSISGLLMMPLTNYISRRYEFQADEYAVRKTSDRESFVSAMNKLAEINLADKEPHPAVEFFLYSHPSIKRRIEFAESIKL
ncbi:MAG TPA: M48 family metallopeptidase [Spirochaetota bacterium]|nr:M48 family metallopeptidase [Spirochaetota bacterium]